MTQADLDLRMSGVERARPAEDDWVISLPLDGSIGRISRPAGWAEQGPLLGFFHGLLSDRDRIEISPGADPTASSDAELVLQIYAHGQDYALKKLRGNFVLAVIDRRSGKAIVMRDAFGTHPLFYAEHGSKLLFAGSPQLLVELAGVSRELNRVALADHLCQRWPDPQESYFAKIRRVPAGWWASISAGRLALERWWHPAPGGAVQWLNRDEVAQFDQLLEQAVARCMEHGRIGIFLSGGFDSVSIAAIASDLARTRGQTPPLALSLGFPVPECDERKAQTSIARQLGLPLSLIDLNEAIHFRPLLEESIKLNEWLPAPVLNLWLPGYRALMERARSEGVNIIVNGEGGDEWLTITPIIGADLIRTGQWLAFIRHFNMLRRSHNLELPALMQNVFWQHGLRPVAGMLYGRLMPQAHQAARTRRVMAGDPAWIAPDPQLRAQQRERVPYSLPASDPQHGFYLRDAAISLEHTVTSWAAEEQYAFGRRAGIQVLRPYFDPDLVELLYRTPPSILTEGGRTKSLVRGVLARRFPSLGFERHRKISAISFINSLLQSQGSALLEACGDFPALSGLGVVDGRVARAYWRHLLKTGPVRRLRHLWVMVNVELWTRSQLK